MAKCRYAAVRHDRRKIEKALGPGQNKVGSRVVTIKVRIDRSTSVIGAGGHFKAWYTAAACPAGSRYSGKRLQTRQDVIRARGGTCGFGYGKTPTAAYKDALKNLAKIKR